MWLLDRFPRARSLAVGLLCALLALGWQALTVHYNYGGNWTALFCTGGKQPVPPELAWEKIYTFPNSNGYDGQFYHYQAHDPFLRKGFSKYMDDPQLRYRRLLVPAAAYLLAGGQDRFVDLAYFGVILFSIFLGAWWLGRYSSGIGRHPAWGLAFLLVPATLVSIDRLTIDVTLAALTVGFALYARQGPGWKLWLLLCCAPLARETGILLPAGFCLYLLWQHRVLRTILFAAAGLPAMAWFAFLQPRTPADLLTRTYDAGMPSRIRLTLLSTTKYDLPDRLAWTMTVLDYLVALGILVALVLAIRYAWNRFPTAEGFAGLLFGLLTIVIAVMLTQQDPYTYPRLVSPLLALVALEGLSRKEWIGLLPGALLAARVAAQLGPQVLGVVRGLAGH